MVSTALVCRALVFAGLFMAWLPISHAAEPGLVAEQLAFRLFQKFVQQISTGNLVESAQALSAIAPILVILTPYIYWFHSQAPSRPWLRQIFQELTGTLPPELRNEKRAWFTDTLEDVNGVATTIRRMAAAGAAAGKELIVVTSRS